jgi:DNA-binding transcriptional regulator YiaG
MNSLTTSSNYGTKAVTRKTSQTPPSNRKRLANARSTSVSKGVAKPTPKPKVVVTPEPNHYPIFRMSAIELRDIAANILPQLRQEDLATLLDINERTMRRWLAGDAEINASATALLRLLRAGRIALADIRTALSQPPGMS